MKYVIVIFVSWMFLGKVNGQVEEKLASAMKVFNADSQLNYAIAALYVVDVASGKTVYTQNAETGMAPASTEKILTAATALDILGAGYVFETRFGIINTPNGKSLYIQPSGDPTLGSWRWEDTKELAFLNRLKAALQQQKITRLQSVIIDKKGWGDDVLPARWTWEDLGNYYGAAAHALNWRENQFDVIVKSGNHIGDPVNIVKTTPQLYDYTIVSNATAAAEGTGDNTNLYYPSLGRTVGVLSGTVPVKQNNFSISGSIYHPANQFVKTIIDHLKGTVSFESNSVVTTNTPYKEVAWVYTNTSPNLSKIVYWFLRKSVNLYGESFLRAMALKQTGNASIDSGIKIVQNHWMDKQVNMEELHLYDGSGLSPQNRITPHAEVSVLQYAKTQNWFDSFYEALPLYNDMKMKSGTINRVKGFTGYQKSKDGKEYVFSMLVNNYNGSEYALIRKMYKVLDCLK